MDATNKLYILIKVSKYLTDISKLILDINTVINDGAILNRRY